MDGQRILRAGAVIQNFAGYRTGVVFIERDGHARIGGVLANVKGNDLVAGGDHARIALEHDGSVVEAQRVVLAVHLVFGFDCHVFQREIGVILYDALNVICIFRDCDGAVLEHKSGVLQQLESVCLRICRAGARTGQCINMPVKINGECFA